MHRMRHRHFGGNESIFGLGTARQPLYSVRHRIRRHGSGGRELDRIEFTTPSAKNIYKMLKLHQYLICITTMCATLVYISP
jgi:hypothetical protein